MAEPQENVSALKAVHDGAPKVGLSTAQTLLQERPWVLISSIE